jgi:hypothetical protein
MSLTQEQEVWLRVYAGVITGGTAAGESSHFVRGNAEWYANRAIEDFKKVFGTEDNVEE